MTGENKEKTDTWIEYEFRYKVNTTKVIHVRFSDSVVKAKKEADSHFELHLGKLLDEAKKDAEVYEIIRKRV